MGRESKMRTVLERWAKVLSRDESAKIAKVLAGVDRNAAVLEIGSGFGRKQALLRRLGFAKVAGVERNPAVAQAARDAGFDVADEAAFDPAQAEGRYDLLVLAHIIEHMGPDDLLVFLERWLRVVRPGGRVLVVTPMPGKDFYLDFDHVKPYLPQGFKDFFGAGDAQVHTHGRRHLKLRDLRYRRSPFRLRHNRHVVLKTRYAVAYRLANLALAGLFFVSRGLIGRTTGWIGLFKLKP
jgi:SAM-dependent methyltransferase